MYGPAIAARLPHSLHEAEGARAQPCREQLGRVWVDRAPRAQVEEADEEERRDVHGLGVRDREGVRGEPAQQQERGECRLAPDAVDEPDRRRVARELRKRAQREQQVDVDREALLRLEHERQPQEEPVVRDVERDPDQSGHEGAAAQGSGDQLARRGPRLRSSLHLIGAHRASGDLGQHLGRLLRPPMPGEEVRALREGPAHEEREERRERGREEQVAPAVVPEAVERRAEENVRETGREQEPDRPPEVEEDEEAATTLRRQVLGEHRRVDDEHPAEPEPGQEAEGHHRPRPPRHRRQRGEKRVPEDRVLEDRPPADAIREPAERQAADERARERRAGDEPQRPPIEIPEIVEDRHDEADEEDLHRDERPRHAGHDHGLAVERRQTALAEDVLDVSAEGRRSYVNGRHRLSLVVLDW